MEINKNLYKHCMQNVFEGKGEHNLDSDIIVPDYLPDVGRIVDVKCCIYINDEKVVGDSVTVAMQSEFTILYVGEKGGCVKTIVHNEPFSHTFNCKDLNDETTTCTRAKVLMCNCKVLNSRKLVIKGSALICLSAYNPCEEITPYVAPKEDSNIEVKMETVDIYTICGVGKKIFNVEETLEIPRGKGSIEQMLKCDTTLFLDETKNVKGKSIIKGYVKCDLLYLTDLVKGTIENATFNVPFSQIVDIKNVNEDSIVDITMDVLSEQFRVLDDGEGQNRIVDFETVIRCTAVASCTMTKNIVTDAYHTKNKINFKKEILESNNLVLDVKEQITIKEVIAKDYGGRDIGKIIAISGIAMLNPIGENDDKISLSGVIEVTLMCGAADEKGGVFTIKKAIPVAYAIKPKAKISKVEGDISPHSFSYNMNMAGEIELRVVCDVTLKGISGKTNNIVSGLEVTSEPFTQEKKPSAVLYYKKQGEKIWDIGKKYGVRMGDLMEANTIKDEKDFANAGVLLIP